MKNLREFAFVKKKMRKKKKKTKKNGVIKRNTKVG